jgi:chemotaxis protein methyltransferase CheR
VLKDHNLSLEQLITKTKTDTLFVEKVIQEITVNTTEFFRDTEVWKELYHSYYPTLKKKNSVNIWHAGCSSGQEVYSNIILLNEMNMLKKSNIVATDLNTQMLKIAKNGRYSKRQNQKYTENLNAVLNNEKSDSNILLEKYFEKTDNNTIEIKNLFKKAAEFQRHDLVKGDIDSKVKFDIIFCRNVLIYFNSTLQTKILKQFHNKLTNGGMLILGNHEGLNGFFKTKFIKDGPVFFKNNTFHFHF